MIQKIRDKIKRGIDRAVEWTVKKAIEKLKLEDAFLVLIEKSRQDDYGLTCTCLVIVYYTAYKLEKWWKK
jgi:hypothetical protein